MKIMANETRKFSAFKLFYDEIIYKDKISVAYENVARNLKRIKELTSDIRKFPKVDIKEYMRKLEKVNKKLKEQLYDIQKNNRALYEYFYIIYQTQVDICTEKVEDMPFVINCSFYEDYRLDNKTVEELESSKFTVPKYNSLEKKKIRDNAKGLTRFEFFVKLISESKNAKNYTDFNEKAKILMNVKYLAKDTREEYFEQIDFGSYKKILSTIENIARESEDYEYITDMMTIAFKRKFSNWNKELDECLIEHYDKKYQEMRSSKEIRGVLNEVNDISYAEYQSIIKKLIDEKNKYMNMFFDDKFVPLETNSDSFTEKFKENLINSFFDRRYNNDIKDNDGVDEYVNRAIALYGLAEDLGNQIFEKVLFDAGHSPVLGRNNDVRSSIIEKIYELYDPMYLLTIYDKARTTFESLLNKNNPRFIQEYNLKLTEKKIRYNFHGPLPSMSIIEMRVNDRKKTFIVDNCVNEMKSKYDGYDTRNYDLSLVASDLYINDMIELYDKMKIKVNNYKNTNNVSNKEQKSIMANLQEFVVKDIYKKLNVKVNSLEEEKSKYRDICHGYLNEKCMFVTDDEQEESSQEIKLEDFLKKRRDYNKKSKWNKMLENYNIRVNM